MTIKTWGQEMPTEDEKMKLFPCPFCGSIPNIKECELAPMAYIECSCGINTNARERDVDLLRIWNHRPHPSLDIEGIVEEFEKVFSTSLGKGLSPSTLDVMKDWLRLCLAYREGKIGKEKV